MGGGVMKARASKPITLDEIATGLIIQHAHQDEDATGSIFQYVHYEWQGGPFARIERSLWSRIPAEVGERRLNKARLGPFELVLMEDNLSVPHEIWYSPPGKAFYGEAPACQG